MKKTKIVYSCDICKKECDLAQPVVFECKFGKVDVCGDCIDAAVKEKLDKTIVCPICKGKGKTKENDGYNGWVWEPCRKCRK